MTGKLGPATFYVGVDGPSCRLGPRPLYSLSGLRGTPLAAGGRSLCRGAVSKGGVPRFPSTKGGFHSLLGRSLCRDPAPNPRPPGLACCLPGANRAPAPGRAQRPTPRLCLLWPTAVPSREDRGAGPESQLFSDLHSRVCPDTGVKQVIRGHSGGKADAVFIRQGLLGRWPLPPTRPVCLTVVDSAAINRDKCARGRCTCSRHASGRRKTRGVSHGNGSEITDMVPCLPSVPLFIKER